MISLENNEVLYNIQKQFFCNVPIKHFNWSNIFDNISLEDQEKLIKSTVDSLVNINYPVDINYQKSFLRFVLEQLEQPGIPVDESVYEAYARLVIIKAYQSCYKHYLLKVSNTPNPIIISLKENPNLISEGTTGLRTWQAGLTLSEWILNNQEHFKDKTVLELGSGIGLLGLVLYFAAPVKEIILSDCHGQVLNNLNANIEFNLNNNQLNNAAINQLNKTNNIRVVELFWQEVDRDFCSKFPKIDIILAADVVYDPALIPSLVQAVNCLKTLCGVEQIIFACTERNPETLEQFLRSMETVGFKQKEESVPNQKNFIWSQESPVRIFCFQ